MNEKIKKKNELVEIDFKRLWKAVWHRAWVICVAAALVAAVSLCWSLFLITPLYQSTAMFYVNNNSLAVGDTSFNITSSDITASKSLVNTYIVILNSRTCLNNVIEEEKLDYSYSELKDMISFGASPRASINLALAARAYAFIKRRGYVIPEDVRAVAHDVLRHRIGLSYEAEASNMTSDEIVSQILNSVEVP